MIRMYKKWKPRHDIKKEAKSKEDPDKPKPITYKLAGKYDKKLAMRAKKSFKNHLKVETKNL